MSFAAPGWLAVAAVAALGVVAIHLIAWRQPESVSLPTARFVPDEKSRRATRTVRLSDLALLALRVAIVLLVGVGMARPSRESARSGVARVIVVERSDAQGNTIMLDTIRALASDQVVSVVAFDTAAQVLHGVDQAAGALAATAAPVHGSLSTGLVAGLREARRLEQLHERVDVAVASSFSKGAFDAATTAIRATWPDPILLIRLHPSEPPPPGSVDVRAAGDDPVAAGIALAQSHGLVRGTARVVRDRLTPDDSAWIGPGRVLVAWPMLDSAQGTVEAIHAGGATAVGYLSRGAAGDSGRVVARWTNGEPAAREVESQGGCIRTIGFDVPDVGDFVLTPSFQRLAAELAGPCGGTWSAEALADSALAAFAARPANRAQASRPGEGSRRLGALLVAVAAMLAIAELLVRGTRAGVGPRVARQDA